MFGQKPVYNVIDVQKAYNNIYREFRNFIWDIDTVMMLGDIEVESYNLFVDIPKVRQMAERFRSHINTASTTENPMDELLKSIDEYLETLDKFEQEGEQSIPIYNILMQDIEEEDSNEDKEENTELDRVRRVDNGSADESRSEPGVPELPEV